MKPQKQKTKLLPVRTTLGGLNHILPTMILFLCLMMASVGAWATDYVFVYNGNYLGVNGSGTITNYTTFNPTYCIWTCDDDLGTTSRSLYVTINGTSYYLMTSQTAGNAVTTTTTEWANWRLNDNHLAYHWTSGRFNTTNNYAYLYYRDNSWRTSNSTARDSGQNDYATVNNRGTITTDYRATLTASTTSAARDNTTAPTISYSSRSATTITLSRTNLTGSYTPTMTTIVVGGTTYYKGSNGVYSTTAPSATLNPTYTWSITSGNASITQNGVVTPSNDNTTNIVVRVTATNADPSITKTTDYTINVTSTAAATTYSGGLNAVNPTNSTLTYNANTSITLDSPSRQKNTTPAYQTYSASGNTFYRVNNVFQNTVPTADITDVALTAYSWALSGAGASNAQLASATGATNTLTYSTASLSDVTAIVTVTADYAEGDDVSKTATINLRMVEQCSTPTITLGANGKVTISAGPGETIYYKTDDSYNDNGVYAVYTNALDVTDHTRIWAYSTRSGYLNSDETNITVADPYNVIPSTYEGINLLVAENYNLSYTLNTPTNGEVIYDRVVYATANPTIATVNQSGKITALTAGTTTVTLTGYKLDGTTLTPVEINVTVRNPYNDPSSLSVNSTNQTLNQGETWQIVATAYGTEPVYQKFKYEVTGTEGVVSVNENGLVKALSQGNTEVTVTAYNYGDVLSTLTQTIQITVVRPTSIDGKTCVYALSDVTNANGNYILMDDISASNGLNITFTGTFDGNYHTISGLTSALFTNINGGTVKNVRLAEVSIPSGTDVGSIANTATNGAKIYNCGVLSGSVNGNRYVGGLVGTVNGSTKVINNYSYASVSGGTYAAGIVGYNADDAYEVNDYTGIRIQNVSSSKYLSNTGTNTTLIITNGDANSNYQKWDLVPTGAGYKLKNVGRGATNPYVALEGAWNATFDNNGEVFTLVPNGDGTFCIARNDGKNLGTDSDDNNSTVYTDKGNNNNRYRWRLYIGNTQLTSLVSYNILPHCDIVNNMFYGDITSGTHVSPIYGGKDINSAIVSSNYNYYSLDDLKTTEITEYNSALAAEKRYLERFEFYRGILNSNRRLAAYYITGQNLNQTDNIDVTQNPIGKWVLDKSIAPFPIIKPWGKYPSLINPEYETTITTLPEDVDMRDDSPRYHGKTLGMLSVTINAGAHGSGSKTIQIPITDMNVDEWDYTYYKIQLPYYNDHWDNNYQAEWVVTGWDITNITGGTAKGFNTNRAQEDGYNFADRSNTSKDNVRTLAQGGWYCVSEGVTAITITAHWGHAVYLADQYVDRRATLNNNLIGGVENNTAAGQNHSYGTHYYNDWNTAASDATLIGETVYDNAVVLVGNFNANTSNYGNKSYTLMSADFDHDNEPDYVIYYRCPGGDRHDLPPIRFDFMQMPGMGMGKKPTAAVNMAAPEILRPTGHFELTETALIRFTEFEYNERDVNGAPLIFNAGIVEQIMSSQHDVSNSTGYILLGGHCWFKEFTPGVHADANDASNYPNNATAHTPITILGGEYLKFYLSGVNEGQAYTADGRRDARIYTNGGYFHMFAGAGQELISGNVLEKFDHSIVDEFFGGGINANKPITGNISVTMNNSLVNYYCGGPKFGNMSEGKKVTTEATGSTFGMFFGAGYGGTSLARNRTQNNTNVVNYAYNDYNRFNYNSTYGINTSYECEFFDWAGATAASHVGRFYNLYASFSLAQTKDVESSLTNCLVKNNFYGGGSLGNVAGNATSTLDGCTVLGNAFGGGFSAVIPTCDVANNFGGIPTYNTYTGIFTDAPSPDTTHYYWHNGDGLSNSNVKDDVNHWIWTNQPLDALGQVSGDTKITILGNSRIDGAVFGGGDASDVMGKTTVIINAYGDVDEGAYKINNVYGGANRANVGGATTVDVTAGYVGNVFGGNNESGTKSSTIVVNIAEAVDSTLGIDNVYGGGNLAPYAAPDDDFQNWPKVNVGTATIEQDVFGGGLGENARVTGNPQVTVSSDCNDCNSRPILINGSVYGGGSAAPVTGDPVVTIRGYDTDDHKVFIGNYVFGGGLGSTAVLTGSTSVNIYGNTEIGKNVYGGGNGGLVTGNTNVTIGDCN